MAKDHGPRVGADPELFIQDREGKVIPICGKIGGTKEQPLIIDHLIEAQYGPEGGRRAREALFDKQGHYAIQEDNVMLEFNVPAYRDRAYFIDSINKALQVIQDSVLAQHNVLPNFQVMHTFKSDDLEKFPQAFMVGCLSDMDAYAENGHFERQPFNAAHFGNNRFCGGHLHVQYNKGNVPPHIFVQFMDIVATLPFLRWDKQKMRRLFYGQPGIYRDKPYGIEYRTPSNYWLGRTFRDKHLPTLVESIYNLAATANAQPEELKKAYSKIDWADVQQAIKTENYKLADDIVEFTRNQLGLYVSAPVMR